MSITRHSCQVLMTHELSRQICEKYFNNEFHKNPSVGAELFHVDRDDEANRRYSQLCKRA